MLKTIFEFIKQWLKKFNQDIDAELAVNMGVFKDILFISIKGDVYGYQPLDDSSYNVKFLSDTFDTIMKETGNSGKALAWLKRNSKVVIKPA